MKITFSVIIHMVDVQIPTSDMRGDKIEAIDVSTTDLPENVIAAQVLVTDVD